MAVRSTGLALVLCGYCQRGPLGTKTLADWPEVCLLTLLAFHMNTRDFAQPRLRRMAN